MFLQALLLHNAAPEWQAEILCQSHLFWRPVHSRGLFGAQSCSYDSIQLPGDKSANSSYCSGKASAPLIFHGLYITMYFSILYGFED
jgi:hypothetical protein